MPPGVKLRPFWFPAGHCRTQARGGISCRLPGLSAEARKEARQVRSECGLEVAALLHDDRGQAEAGDPRGDPGEAGGRDLEALEWVALVRAKAGCQNQRAGAEGADAGKRRVEYIQIGHGLDPRRLMGGSAGGCHWP